MNIWTEVVAIERNRALYGVGLGFLRKIFPDELSLYPLTDFIALVLNLVSHLIPSSFQKVVFSVIQVFVAFILFIHPSKHISFDLLA